MTDESKHTPNARQGHLKEHIPVAPAMVNVVAMGLFGMLAYNGLLRIPGVGPAVARVKEATRTPMNWIGGKEFAENPRTLDLGNAVMSFFIDAVISVGMTVLVGRTKVGRDVYNKSMDFTEKQTENLSNLAKRVFGHGPSPAA